MNTEPEDNPLDQSLRELFDDYNFPPAEHMHVWAAVEGRIANLPAPRVGFPYRLVLPFTAALGIGVASVWWLAQPAEHVARPVAAAPAAFVTAPALPRPAQNTTLTQVENQLIEKLNVSTELAPKAASVLPVASRQQPARAVVSHSGVAQHGAAVQVRPDAIAPAPTAVTVTPELPPVAADSNTDNSPGGAPVATLPATYAPKATPVQETANEEARPEGSGDRVGYRKPFERKAERTSGLRRWMSRFGQRVRRLF